MPASCQNPVSYTHLQVIISAGDVPLGTQGNLFGITGGEGTEMCIRDSSIRTTSTKCRMEREMDHQMSSDMLNA